MKKIGIILFVLVITWVSCSKDDDEKAMNPIPDTVTDIDGNLYHTISIGEQV